MSTSYANLGGTGYRIGPQLAYTSGAATTGTVNGLIDGTLASLNFSWVSNVSAVGVIIKVDMGAANIVDEAKWYQSGSQTQGTWQWFGSNDDSTYTAIGATFTLGGSTVQTQTTLNGNTTLYRWYKLQGSAGTVNSTPWLQGLEFKIDVPVAIDYWNPYGHGDRTSSNLISLTQSTIYSATIGSNGDVIRGLGQGVAHLERLVNGVIDSGGNIQQLQANQTVDLANAWLEFDFGTGIAVVIDEVTVWGDDFSTNLTCKLQGSNNNSTWTDLASSAVWVLRTRFANSSNATPYRYYRIFVVSGIPNSVIPFVFEIYFLVSTAMTPPSSFVANPLSGTNPLQGFLS